MHTLPVMIVLIWTAACTKIENQSQLSTHSFSASRAAVNLSGGSPLQFKLFVTTLAGSGMPTFADGNGIAASFNSPAGIARDNSGNIYIADQANNKIRKIDASGQVSVLAGSGMPGSHDDASGANATFNSPTGIAVDASGNVFVADKGNHRIRMVTQSGAVSTIAGSDSGHTDLPGTLAQFASPSGITLDRAGNIYVADTKNNCIRFIDPSHNVNTIAGLPDRPAGHDSGSIGTARFFYPVGITIDVFNNILVTDSTSVRRIFGGFVHTIAGGESIGFDDKTGNDARFNGPAGMTTDASGNIYVADRYNHRIRFVKPDGSVTTFAGNGSATFHDDALDKASFNVPAGIIFDFAGNIYVADQGNNRIREMTIVATTLAGSTFGLVDDVGTKAKFWFPANVATDAAGNIYVADAFNNRIRKITPGGSVTTLAGSGGSGPAAGGYHDDVQGTRALFNSPEGVAVDASGNVYVADQGNNRIRKITPGGSVTTLAGDGNANWRDGAGTVAEFNRPQDVAVDASGNVYVTDRGNSRVRKITPDGTVSTFAGNGIQASIDGAGDSSSFNLLSGIAVDAAGNVFVAEHAFIRMITPARRVSTIAGNGTVGSGDGPAFFASFNNPSDIVVDASGTIYVMDMFNNKVRKITGGFVSTLAGTGSITGFADGAATRAKFAWPTGIALDPSGILYIADQQNHLIRTVQ